MKRLLNSIAEQAGRLPTGKFFGLLTQPNIFPILLFALALSIRAFYVLHCEHLVCEFGDAYYYLTTGAALAKVLSTATDWTGLFQQITSATPISPEDGSTFTSSQLPVRLMLDGPIYPAYLAVLASIFGFASQAKMQFNNYATQISLANSCIDSFSCLLIYSLGGRAFGRKVGAMAAVLFAFYPAASINLSRAYSETFSYFLLLSLMSTAVVARVEKLRTAALCGIALQFGFLFACVTLVRPIFVLVVVSIVASLVLCDLVGTTNGDSKWYRVWFGKRRLAALVLSAIGALIIFIPWSQITGKSLGQPTFLLSRAPAYNLFVGNQVVTDGWKTWPIVPGCSGDTKVVMNGILENFLRQPFEMVALELKKVPRLWAGGWNEFRYPFFGLSVEGQNIWHGVLLLLAFIGVCLTAARIRSERHLVMTFVGLSSFSIICVHFLYVGFEPISRYGLTAMPFVCLFAAVSIVALVRQHAILHLSLLVIGGALFIGFLERKISFAPTILQTFSAMRIGTARIVEEVVVLAFWFLLAQISIRAIAAAKGSALMLQSRNLVIACFAVAGLSWFAAAHFDRSNGEWFCDIRTQVQTISQDAAVPPAAELASWLSETKGANCLDPQNTIFVLFDCEHDMGQPAVAINVNRITWRTVALPWNQVLGKEGDISTIMNMQGSAMTKDWRSFRQWWAIPIPRGLLKPGAANEIAINFEFAEATPPVRVFGDYFPTEDTETLNLPSFDFFSWTRGFATYDTRDTRVYSLIPGLAKVTNPALWFVRTTETKDLSTEPGLQTGAYRIRFAIPRAPAKQASTKQEQASLEQSEAKSEQAETFKTEQSKPPKAEKLEPLKPEQFEEFAPVSLAKRLDEVTIDGGNPLSYKVFRESQKLPANIRKGAIVDFGCLIKSDRKRQGGPISVILEGTNEKGELQKYNFPWQPTAVSYDVGYRRFHASYIIPDRILGLKNPAVSVVVSPFPIDELVLNKKKAIQEVLIIKDANLTLYSPLPLPSNNPDWMIF